MSYNRYNGTDSPFIGLVRAVEENDLIGLNSVLNTINQDPESSSLLWQTLFEDKDSKGWNIVHIMAIRGCSKEFWEAILNSLSRTTDLRDKRLKLINLPAVSGYLRPFPLHLAAWNGHTGTVQALLELKAHVNALNANGEKPVQKAEEKEQWECVKILQKVQDDSLDRKKNYGNV